MTESAMITEFGRAPFGEVDCGTSGAAATAAAARPSTRIIGNSCALSRKSSHGFDAKAVEIGVARSGGRGRKRDRAGREDSDARADPHAGTRQKRLADRREAFSVRAEVEPNGNEVFAGRGRRRPVD